MRNGYKFPKKMKHHIFFQSDILADIYVVFIGKTDKTDIIFRKYVDIWTLKTKSEDIHSKLILKFLQHLNLILSTAVCVRSQGQVKLDLDILESNGGMCRWSIENIYY
jgi:hypothetical protein